MDAVNNNEALLALVVLLSDLPENLRSSREFRRSARNNNDNNNNNNDNDNNNDNNNNNNMFGKLIKAVGGAREILGEPDEELE